MKKRIFFTERQRIRQPWILALFLALLGIPFFLLLGMVRQIALGRPFGNPPMSDTELIILTVVSFVVIIGLILLMLMIRIDTEVNSSGIRLKASPFHSSFRLFRWEEISKVYIKRYNPFSEFGVRGSRVKFGARTQVYGLFGMQRLHIELKNGKRVLIGTQKEKELARALRKVEENISNKQSKI